MLDPAFGLDQLDVYDAPQRNAGHAEPERRAEVLRAALARLAKRDIGPSCLSVRFDPHVPYTPPRAFSEQAGGDAYLGEVASTDAALGRLAHLESDGTSDSTTLVVAADHGESLGEHGEPTHGALCYNSTVRVPLLVRWPDARDAGRREDSLVSVSRRLSDAAGSPARRGANWSRRREPLPPPARALAACTCESYSGWLNYGWSPLAAWVDGARGALRQLAAGVVRSRARSRVHDISAKPPLSVAPYDSALRAVLEGARLPPEHVEAFDPGAAGVPARAGLRRDGQGAATSPSPFETSDLPSPRERAVELAPLALASALADAGCPAEALPLLREILAANPHHWLALGSYPRDGLGRDRRVRRRASCVRTPHAGRPASHRRAPETWVDASSSAATMRRRSSTTRPRSNSIRDNPPRWNAARGCAGSSASRTPPRRSEPRTRGNTAPVGGGGRAW